MKARLKNAKKNPKNENITNLEMKFCQKRTREVQAGGKGCQAWWLADHVSGSRSWVLRCKRKNP